MFKLQGTPMRVEFRTGRNPFVNVKSTERKARKALRRAPRAR
jgi:hypothetical protein